MANANVKRLTVLLAIELMSDWQRIIYVSKATFSTGGSGAFVEPEVGRILVQSRRNNPLRNLVGALYYADRHFFQCLEGTADALDRLLADLSKDPRHTDIRILSRSAIAQPSFSGWSMKYVPAAVEVKKLLREFGHQQFDPYRFDPQQTERMVLLLREGPDVSPSNHALPTGASDLVSQQRWDGARTARWALVVSVLALGCSLAALALSVMHS